MKIFGTFGLKIVYQLVVALDIFTIALAALVSCLVLETQIFSTSEIFSGQQHTVFILQTQYSGTREGSSISLTSLATEIISYL